MSLIQFHEWRRISNEFEWPERPYRNVGHDGAHLHPFHFLSSPLFAHVPHIVHFAFIGRMLLASPAGLPGLSVQKALQALEQLPCRNIH